MRTLIRSALLLLALSMNPSLFAQDGDLNRQWFLNERAEATWSDSDDGLFRVFPESITVDIDGNGVPELRFQHTYRPRPERVNARTVELLRMAEAGLIESKRVALGLRGLANSISSESDTDRILRLQEEVERGKAAIASISRTSTPSGILLLDGSLGKRVYSGHDQLTAITATSSTQPNSYAVFIDTAGERAKVEAGETQAAALRFDEVLVINGVSIELQQGMTQLQVIDRINESQPKTGVLAGKARSGASQLYTELFGSAAELRVVSNIAASADSSGFGNSMLIDAGVDVAGSIGPLSFQGVGQELTATGGIAKGLAVRAEASRFDPTTTSDGPAVVDVTDESPSFFLSPAGEEIVSISLPNIAPPAIGRDVEGSLFRSLEQVSIVGASHVNDSLRVIEKTIEDLADHTREVSTFLSDYAYPYGMGLFESLNGTEYLLAENGALLPDGSVVGPNGTFVSGDTWLQDSKFLREQSQRGFVGVRFPSAEGWQYGWVGVELDLESSIRITEAAWGSIVDQAVVTVAVPEPATWLADLAIVSCLGSLVRRKREI